jgi:hypothetical protein
MKKQTRSGLAAVLTFAAVIFLYQNCTPQKFGKQGQSTNHSKSGGNYDGKVYLYNDAQNPCDDGNVTIARIAVDKEKFLLERDACKNLKAPQELPESQLFKSAEYLIYSGKTFGNFSAESQPKLICDSTGMVKSGSESETLTILIKEESGVLSGKSIENKIVGGKTTQVVTAFTNVSEVTTGKDPSGFDGSNGSGRTFSIYSRLISPQSYPDGQSNGKLSISNGSASAFLGYGVCREQ